MSSESMNRHKNLKKGLCLLLLCIQNAFAVPCVITVIKSPCWSDYDVSVNILDASSNSSLSKVTITKGVSWQRTTFECQPEQVLSANATFTPEIWKGQQGIIYQSVRFWGLPNQAPESGSSWSINICYPKQFKGVPSPLNATNCECSLDGIPPVENTNVNVNN